MKTRYFLPAIASIGLASLAVPAAAQDVTVRDAPTASGLVQDYDPAPAMWRLSDEDTTIYMLGTVHLLPEGFRWRNDQLDAIVAEVDALVLETSEADSDASFTQLAPKFEQLLSSRTPTSQQLVPAARAGWRRLVAQSGQPFEVVDSMPLMVALMGFGTIGTDLGPSSYEWGVETVLTREFTDTDRPVGSIEDSGRVMMSLYRIDDDLVLRDLERDLIRWDGRNTDAFLGETPSPEDITDWDLEHQWARGEVQDGLEFGINDAKLSIAFNRVLLTNRNRRWAVWLEERLETPGTILLAVGAGHFEGQDSVLEMLLARGLTAERINSPAE